MKKCLALPCILLLNFSLFSQEINELDQSIIDSLSSEAKDQLSSEDQNIVVQDSFAPIENTIVITEESKFGFDFFESNPVTNTPVTDLPMGGEYIISYADSLKITLTGKLNRAYDLKVSLGGTILVPEIGEIMIVGETIFSAERKINNLIKESYIGTTSFLEVVEASLRKISIVGSVQNPGTYLVNPFATVSESIKYAGGLTENASLRTVKISNPNRKEEKIIDLYDLLINGDRTSDVSLQNGDTISVSAAQNFVKIFGSVNRPMIYELLEGDSLNYILKFAQGVKFDADRENISATVLDGKIFITKTLNVEYKHDDKYIREINVPSFSFSDSLRLYVEGSPVSNGFFGYDKGEMLAKFLEQLNFSEDVYPFFFKFKQSEKKGKKNELYFFSLDDPKTYEGIYLKDNPELTFFSKNDFYEFNEIEDKISDLIFEQESITDTDGGIFNPRINELEADINDLRASLEKNPIYENVNRSSYLSVSFGDEDYVFPMSGVFSTSELYDFLDKKELISSDSAYAVYSEGIVENAFEKKINFQPNMSVLVPKQAENIVTVNISGEVKYPGEYDISPYVTLYDLYVLAGGFTERADQRGIFLSRESVKEKERIAFDDARKLLASNIYETQANQTSGGNLNVSLLALLNDPIFQSFPGRVSGNLRFDSKISKSLTLEESDNIIVPPIRNFIIVSGEVQSPSSIVFEENFTVNDYIEAAGGLTRFANKSKIYVIKADGTSVPYNRFGSNYVLQPGDLVQVPKNLGKVELIPIIAVVSQVMANLALSAASLNAISN
tara:strand:- start:2049 stop:4403 length:2355 start_codon:yes stop_codon:yes gene_type:complete